MKIALQLYTVRNDAQRDLAGTLRKVWAAGYSAVEAARIPFNERSAGIFLRAREDFGLQVCSCQVKFHDLRDDFIQLSGWMHRTKCDSAVVSVLPWEVLLRGRSADLEWFCTELNALGKRYRNEGIRLAYHHHHMEFLQFGARRGMEILLANLDPASVAFVSDTYWAQRAGINPAELLARMDGRLLGIHLRDITTRRRGPLIYASDCSVGSGLLNIRAVWEQAEKSGAEYAAVEQNSRAPFADIASSFRALARMPRRDQAN